MKIMVLSVSSVVYTIFLVDSSFFDSAILYGIELGLDFLYKIGYKTLDKFLWSYGKAVLERPDPLAN